jgi:ATP-dependent RNA circularization protein (DNA/RNA ligase family)
MSASTTPINEPWAETHTRNMLRTGIVGPMPEITPTELEQLQRHQNLENEHRYMRLLTKLDLKLRICVRAIEVATTVEPMDYTQEMAHVQGIEDAFRKIFNSGEDFLQFSFLMRNVITMAEKDPLDHKYDVEIEKDEEDEEDEKDG